MLEPPLHIHGEKSMPNWSVICAINDEEVLRRCLASSPDIRSAREVILQQGCASAARAYNTGVEKATADLLVLVHQDVYLPEGWLGHLTQAVAVVSAHDPNWGVLGVWGVRSSGEGAGFLYCGATQRILGHSFEGGAEVETLDEVLLVLRKSSGLRFDERLGGFHMYGADICMEARTRSMKCYAIPAFCVHNTSQYAMLPLQFWQAYLAMRRKWYRRLPIRTTCTEITRWSWPMIRWNLVRATTLAPRRDPPPAKRVENPRQLYRELVTSGLIDPPDGRRAHSREHTPWHV
jgi:hypothetical protein